MNSFFDYVEGSATAAYRAAVDQAAELAEQQKREVDPIHHEKIDRLLDTYARKLAENTNKRNEIATRVPSILISGGSNFPVRKKEKQNQADDAAMAEWKEIQSLLDKIRGTGKGGISADDPEAVAKLKTKVSCITPCPALTAPGTFPAAAFAAVYRPAQVPDIGPAAS